MLHLHQMTNLDTLGHHGAIGTFPTEIFGFLGWQLTLSIIKGRPNIARVHEIGFCQIM